jgi:hypothetical protein
MRGRKGELLMDIKEKTNGLFTKLPLRALALTAALALPLGFTACGTFQALLGGGTEGAQQRQGEGDDAIAQQELDALNQEIALIHSQADQLPDSADKRRRLQQFRDLMDKYGWPSDTRYATQIRREVQTLKDWVAEAAAAEEERLAAIAAANARGVTEADFTVDVTQDGRGVIITGYKGMATAVRIPAAIQGMPVRVIRGFSRSSITSVVIPEGVTTIDRQAFNNCEQLAQVTLPSTLKSIEAGAFPGTALKAVVIPRGVTEIGESTFRGCTSLASVTIPNSVTKINDSAFYGCTSLASVTIPNSVTMIGGFAFSDCTSLTTVTISPVQRNFGYGTDSVFRGCSKLSLASQAALRAAGYTNGFN